MQTSVIHSNSMLISTHSHKYEPNRIERRNEQIVRRFFCMILSKRDQSMGKIPLNHSSCDSVFIRFKYICIMNNLDEILFVPNLSLTQSIEELQEEIKRWKDREMTRIQTIYEKSMTDVHLFYEKVSESFEDAKSKVMDDFDRIVQDCSEFTTEELDLYLERILKNVEKLKTIKPIELRDFNSISIDASVQPILISEWIDPLKIHFSQSTIHGHTSLDYRMRMKTGKWMWNRHPDEHPASSALRVALINGHYVSFDNRRLYAAQDLCLKRIPVVQVNLDDVRPKTMMTWRKSFENRLKTSKLPAEGTSTQPQLKF